MKTTILSLALSLGLLASAAPAFSQSVGDDVKQAGHDTKTAVKKGVHKSADAVADKTDTTK